MTESERVLDQPVLTPQQRSELRARAHSLKPVVMISTKGASPAVIAEIDRALTHHELIKIRVLEAERDERDTLLAAVCDATGAQPVQHIGKILVIYRQTPKIAEPDPQEVRPGKSARAPDRRAPDRRIPKRSAPKTPASPRRFVSEERRRMQQRRRPSR